MKYKTILLAISLLVLGFICGINEVQSQEQGTGNKNSVAIENKNTVPSMATWGMRKDLIDLAAKNTPFKVLTSLRGAGTNLDHFTDEVHAQFKTMVAYASEKGISLVADLDIRMALSSFEKKYPNDLQQMMVLQEIDLSKNDSPDVRVQCRTLSDHYLNPYLIRSGSFVRAYSYTMNDGVINPSALKDISSNCKVLTASKEMVQVKLPELSKDPSAKVMVMVSFTVLYPDIFSKAVIDFQRGMIRKYADIPLGGVLKDEWGFPPSLSEESIFSDYWYSKSRAEAYAERTGGRELLADLLLMAKGIQGKEKERLMAINHFNEMCWKRNGEIEDDFYQSVKKSFGPEAIVAVHSTWFPFPEKREFKKNGLDWWITTRDLAQTDEIVPYGVRTSLAKKWGNTVWYNMDHTIGLPPHTLLNADLFVRSLWSSALAGGRINNLPIDVRPEGIVGSDYIRAETRIHLLNYINPVPLDCPVAVIFGHTSAMNWAGKGFDDVGTRLVDSLRSRGIAADLIPTSEIWNGSLKTDQQGYISYGKQQYKAVILYNPEFEKETTGIFFTKASKGKTNLYRIGDWKKDFNGNDFNGEVALPRKMVAMDDRSIVDQIFSLPGIAATTPATRDLDGFGHTSLIPPTTGFCRLVDGTLIQVAGTNNGAGDPIKSTLKIGKYPVSFEAVGLAAVRLYPDGKPDALAASELKSFAAGDFKINLEKTVDLALWHNEKGEWEGVIQGWQGNIPAGLLAVAKKWQRIDLPEPYPAKEKKPLKSVTVKEETVATGNQVRDIDGNVYSTVKIGNQIWMTDNLRTGRYSDGNPISGDYTWYDQDSVNYDAGYGKLYTGRVLTNKNVCPTGWHVPSAEDWTALIDYLKGKGNGFKSGFHPVAGGYQWGFGKNFVSLNKYGNWWSSSGTGKRAAWGREKQNLFYIEDRGLSTEYSLSIRCVKD